MVPTYPIIDNSAKVNKLFLYGLVQKATYGAIFLSHEQSPSDKILFLRKPEGTKVSMVLGPLLQAL